MNPKPVVWIGSSKEDLKSLPATVQDVFGYALYLAQVGKKHPETKPLHGFGGVSVLEVVEDYRGNTYRAVYTVRFAEAMYVLHVFQKKSKHGVAAPKSDLDLIKERLKRAQEFHATWKR
jgi:phage-related protein